MYVCMYVFYMSISSIWDIVCVGFKTEVGAPDDLHTLNIRKYTHKHTLKLN